MVSQTQIALIVGIVACFATTAYAVNCYQCESGLQEKCGENFDPEGAYKSDCSKVPVPRYLQQFLGIKNATGCMKTVTELENQKHIFRSCYFGDIHNTAGGCAADPSKFGLSKQLSCDVCTSDLCNGSSSLAAGAVLLVAAAFSRLFL